MKNKNGLSRTIHPTIKEKIRKKSGFACVVCGNALYQYEHVDPEFSEAISHDPNKMTLLCGTCHDKVTRKIWSKDFIKSKMEKPYSYEFGHVFGDFDFHRNLIVELGDTKFLNCKNLLTINNEVIISITENNSGEKYPPFYLNAKFYDKTGQDLLEIENNEWKAFSKSWDIIHERKDKITFLEIKGSENEIYLKLIFNPPSGIKISNLEMIYKNQKISIDKNILKIIGETTTRELILENCKFENFKYAININDQTIELGKS
ncbi:hypothetical protein CH372_18490 [Leptospira meyeri]|uniref:HNH endonuclease n=1 Tax=Leptospira meyeri TaxID=29508 RepID=UPI000C29DA80|nr:hypothetical protein [Leptospira meyeri]PKA10613.1 hypothetical protein CH372_18490 [Leptospira meyeri]